MKTRNSFESDPGADAQLLPGMGFTKEMLSLDKQEIFQKEIPRTPSSLMHVLASQTARKQFDLALNLYGVDQAGGTNPSSIEDSIIAKIDSGSDSEE